MTAPKPHFEIELAQLVRKHFPEAVGQGWHRLEARVKLGAPDASDFVADSVMFKLPAPKSAP